MSLFSLASSLAMGGGRRGREGEEGKRWRRNEGSMWEREQERWGRKEERMWERDGLLLTKSESVLTGFTNVLR